MYMIMYTMGTLVLKAEVKKCMYMYMFISIKHYNSRLTLSVD